MSGMEFILPAAMMAASAAGTVATLQSNKKAQEAAEYQQLVEMHQMKKAQQRQAADLSQHGDMASRQAAAEKARMEAMYPNMSAAYKGVLEDTLNAEQRDIEYQQAQGKADTEFALKHGRKAISSARNQFQKSQLATLIGGAADVGSIGYKNRTGIQSGYKKMFGYS